MQQKIDLRGLYLERKSHVVMKFLCIFIISFIGLTLFSQENCNNLVDDDEDGLIDLLDPDCICQLSDMFNFVPNGDFELKNGCCPAGGQFDDCMEEWFTIVGTPDYYDSNCLSQAEIDEFFNFFGILVSSSTVAFGTANTYSESIATCLNQTLLAGHSYTLQLEANMFVIDPFQPKPDGKFTIFGFASCDDIQNYNYSTVICNSGLMMENLAQISNDDIDLGPWTTHEIEFTPSMDIEAIALAGDCIDGNSGNSPFYMINKISIVGNSNWTYEDSIQINGNPCDFVFYLEVQDSDTLSYQWYFEGEAIVGATDYRIQLNGQNPSTPGLYQVTIMGPSGCSLTDEFFLEVPVIYTADSFYICPGDSIFVGIKFWDEPGSYTIKYLDTIDPCQIQLEFFIEWYDKYEFITVDTFCSGTVYEHRGKTYNKSGTFTEYFKTVNDCDSLYILELYELPGINDTLNVTICNNQTYLFGNELLTEPGEYSIQEINSYGCDSIVVLNLLVEDIILGDTTFVEIEDGTSYNFNGTEIDMAGVYVDTLMSSFGCDSIDILSLSISVPCNISSEIITTEADCLTEMGTITVTIEGGNEGYRFSIDNGISYSYTGIFDNVVAGNYELLILDDEGCSFTFDNIIVNPSVPLSGDLSSTQTIYQGDSVTLSINNLDFTYETIQWMPSIGLSCDSCLITTAKPTNTTTYSVLLTDENGCTLELTTTITVRADTDLYVPNIFSPNEDGINDIFLFFGTQNSNHTILKMSIYDRWGNQVYLSENQTLKTWSGWDGKYNGRAVSPGVYSYYVLIDGFEKAIVGDITIIR